MNKIKAELLKTTTELRQVRAIISTDLTEIIPPPTIPMRRLRNHIMEAFLLPRFEHSTTNNFANFPIQLETSNNNNNNCNSINIESKTHNVRNPKPLVVTRYIYISLLYLSCSNLGALNNCFYPDELH